MADFLQIEWLVINALREGLTLVNDGEKQSYNETIRFAKESFGELFKRKNSHFKKKRIVSREYEKFEQKAEALSKASGRNTTAEYLINEEISQLNNLIKAPENGETKTDQLKREVERLKRLLRENEPKFTVLTENEALRNDFRIERPYMKYHGQQAGKANYYITKSKKQFTLRFLHPDKAEAATGVDFIYEFVDAERERIRIVAIQYKLWEKGTLYFSSAANLESQLQRAKACFCDDGYCEAPNNSFSYRLPYCAPFLRPTDKIQNTENLFTSGWHLPLCQVSKVTTEGNSDLMIKIEDIKNVALTTEQFELLFLQEKIGSRWLSYNEVEDFYWKNKILRNDESIRIITQRLNI